MEIFYHICLSYKSLVGGTLLLVGLLFLTSAGRLIQHSLNCGKHPAQLSLANSSFYSSGIVDTMRILFDFVRGPFLYFFPFKSVQPPN